MRIVLVTPAPAGSLSGNRATAERWAARLSELSHEVAVTTSWDGAPADLLVALHAVKSGRSVDEWLARRPDAPVVIGLAGTDLHGGLDARCTSRLRAARRLVALQPVAARRLPDDLRGRVDVVLQSARPPEEVEAAPPGRFRACVLAHLRAVKDPLLPALAARRLPEASSIEVVHAGEALEEELEAAARAEHAANPRWCWRGALDRAEASRLLAGSHVLVVPSRSEGGANVVSEALAAGVPVLASDVDGNVGLLGADWPGLFPPGDAAALAALLSRCEQEPELMEDLRRRTAALQPSFTPERERAAWAEVLRRL